MRRVAGCWKGGCYNYGASCEWGGREGAIAAEGVLCQDGHSWPAICECVCVCVYVLLVNEGAKDITGVSQGLDQIWTCHKDQIRYGRVPRIKSFWMYHSIRSDLDVSQRSDQIWTCHKDQIIFGRVTRIRPNMSQ